MFGGLKKKLQDAIARVTVPKKEEIEAEISLQERKELRKELKEEIHDLQTREVEAREHLQERTIGEPEHKLQHLQEVMHTDEQKETHRIEHVEEKIAEQADITQLAQEEFKHISQTHHEHVKEREHDHHPPAHHGHHIPLEQLKPVTDLKDQRRIEVHEQYLHEEFKQEQQEIKEEIHATYEPAARIVSEKPRPHPVPHPEPKRTFLSNIVKRIAEKTMDEHELRSIVTNLQMALLENDTALEVAEQICDEVQASLVGQSVKRGEVEHRVKDALAEAMLHVMQQETIDIAQRIEEKNGPLVVMMLGFNGVGKTTQAAKLANLFKRYDPVIAAGDTFRAASIEQLEEHGRRLGIRIVKHSYGSDSAAVIFDAKKHASASGSKLVIADTAGRSHSNVNLMEELKKVVRVNQPDLKILVLDSITGNDIYDQARLFNDAVGIDGIILTKADVYDRGGAALSASYTIKKPILYLGVGQNYDDLRPFRPGDVVQSLLE